MWRIVCSSWSNVVTFTRRVVGVLSRPLRTLRAAPNFLQHSTVLTQAVGPLVKGLAVDLPRNKQELLLENALLRQQLIVVNRQVKRPHFNNTDRAILVLLAARLRTWQSTLFVVKPATLLRWHRAGFQLFWRLKSRKSANKRKPKIAPETIALIKRMAVDNTLWGAERIRGELLKLDIRVAKRTIQKYMASVRPPVPKDAQPSQSWSTFLHNHASQVWACDYLQVYDLFFRPLFIFFIIELGSRRVVHFRITRNPTDEWTSQQLREATPFGEQPKYLIRDNDKKFGQRFKRIAEVSNIKILRTPFQAPRANAFCERFQGSVRRECTDHILVFTERHLHNTIAEYVDYFNDARPHQGIAQAIPGARQRQINPPEIAPQSSAAQGKIVKFPVLGGLHHDYRRVA